MESSRELETSSPGSSDLWYALRCKSNMEFVVNDQLKAKFIPNYLPVYSVDPVNPRSRSIKPYFPGYLFINEKPEALYAQRVFLMRGVIGLVNFDDIPASIHPNLIEAVRRQTRQLNLDRKQVKSGFKPGDPVLVESSSVGQIEGIFEKCVNGEERVIVLLKMMQGSMMRMELSAEMVRRIPVKCG